MADKAQSTEVSKAGAFDLSTLTKEGIPDMLNTIDTKLAEIQQNLPKEAKTTGELSGFGKIKNIDSVSSLIMAYASIAEREKAYKTAATECLPATIKVPALKIDGSTPNAWKIDIKARIINVAYKTKLEALKKVKSELEARMSEEDKWKKSMQNIGDLLNM